MMSKVFLSLILAVLISVMISISAAGEQEKRGADGTMYRKFRPYINGLTLPIWITTFFLMNLLFDGWQKTSMWLLGFVVQIVVVMTLYYGLMLLLLPVLRKHISARVCSTLWLVPTIMGLALAQRVFWNETIPRWVISIPSGWGRRLVLIWIVGTVAVLGWNTLAHLRFRREILADAKPVTEERVLRVWEQELSAADINRSYSLMYAPQVGTPMSVGMSDRTIQVLLPENSYTEEELAMIFRHELVHICRRDGENKFFLTFCKALCWFNPLMWVAMQKSADDMELSCDETVLAGANDTQRRKYADLLLSTAGEERGFTTCLSASARAMRYRLKHVMEPKKRRLGALLAGVLAFVMMMSCGTLSVAYDRKTGTDYIFEGNRDAYQVGNVWIWEESGRENPRSDQYECCNMEQLMDYLAEMPMKRLAGDYDIYGKTDVVEIGFADSDRRILIRDRILRINFVYGANREAETYWLEEPVDMELIESCLKVKD